MEANHSERQSAPRTILSLLASSNASEQREAIALCRAQQDPSTIEPLLAILEQGGLTDSIAQTMLMELLADITHRDFAPALQGAIARQPDGDTKALLLSLTWQNAGDCTSLLPTLVEAMMSPHMLTVIEAMTGIEVNAERLPSPAIASLLKTLNGQLKAQPRPTHANLIEETISLLSQMLLAVQSAEREAAKHSHDCDCGCCHE